MRGNETFKIAVRSIEEVCREVLDAAGLKPSDVDWFVPHQANQRIIDAVGTRLEIPSERCYVNIDRFGNTSAASIPIALDEAVRKDLIKRGDIVLMAAFGAGLTWGASVLAGDALRLSLPRPGSQYSGMGRALAEAYPEAREAFDGADRALGLPTARSASRAATRSWR